MKPTRPTTPRQAALALAAILTLAGTPAHAAVTLGTDDNFTTSGTANGNLQITGDLSAVLGFDLGTSVLSGSLAALQIDYYGGTDKTLKFDLIDAAGTFEWRDAIGTTARSKMTLDANNVLKVHNAAGSAAGVSLDGNTGVISLTGTTSGISANGTPIFALDSSGNVNFATARPLSIADTTAATVGPSPGAMTGALTVAGGIASLKDAYINRVRVGRGSGNSSGNAVLGASALNNNTIGSNIVAVGSGALNQNTTGFDQTAVGNSSLYNSTTGVWNTAVGAYASYSSTTGHYNSALGASSLYGNLTGNYNTALGSEALRNSQAGSSNVAIGSNAGKLQASGSDLTSISTSIFLGASTRAAANSDSNSIVIGNAAVGEGSNTTVIGNSSTTTTHLYGESNLDSLRVTGTTVLEGQVIIDVPQGDISMGDYAE